MGESGALYLRPAFFSLPVLLDSKRELRPQSGQQPLYTLIPSSRPRARLPRAVVRRPQVGKLGEQIVVRAYPIPRHFPIRDDRQEGIGGVVAGCAAIVRR